MRRRVILPIGVIVWLLALAGKPEIELRPIVFFAGGSTRLTCRVPRDERNRLLRMGFEFYRTAEYQLDGKDAPITFERVIEKVPCDPGAALCEVIRSDGVATRATTEPVMAGCTSNP